MNKKREKEKKKREKREKKERKEEKRREKERNEGEKAKSTYVFCSWPTCIAWTSRYCGECAHRITRAETFLTNWGRSL
jgi:hypothetical protein